MVVAAVTIRPPTIATGQPSCKQPQSGATRQLFPIPVDPRCDDIHSIGFVKTQRGLGLRLLTSAIFFIRFCFRRLLGVRHRRGGSQRGVSQTEKKRKLRSSDRPISSLLQSFRDIPFATHTESAFLTLLRQQKNVRTFQCEDCRAQIHSSVQ